MLERKTIKRYIAFLMIICLVFVNLQSLNAYADNTRNILIKNILDDYQSEHEKEKESEVDQSSHKTAGNWWLVDYDGISRNTFHNEVQKDIIKNNGEYIIKKEKPIYYGEKNKKELQGKTGRADIIVEYGRRHHHTRARCMYLYG